MNIAKAGNIKKFDIKTGQLCWREFKILKLSSKVNIAFCKIESRKLSLNFPAYLKNIHPTVQHRRGVSKNKVYNFDIWVPNEAISRIIVFRSPSTWLVCLNKSDARITKNVRAESSRYPIVAIYVLSYPWGWEPAKNALQSGSHSSICSCLLSLSGTVSLAEG